MPGHTKKETQQKMNKRPSATVRSHLPFVIALLLISLTIRILPYHSMVFTGGDPIILDPDACYHLRRAELCLHSLPAIPVFDSYINYPHGAFIIWPPLYDLIIAGLWAISNPLSNQASLPATVPFLPPLLFAITVLIVYAMGLTLWPKKRWAAFGAALAPAILPITVLYSHVGQLDHHAAELLCVALFLYSLLQQMKKRPPSTGIDRAWLATGLFFGAGILVQHGLLLLEAVLLFSLLPLFRRQTRSQALAIGTIVNAMAFLVTVPFGLYSHLQGVPLAHTHFGLFQPLTVLSAALLYGTLWLLTAPLARSKKYWRPVGGIASACLALILIAFLLHQTLEGTAYLVRTWSGWQAQIAESHSLVRISLPRAFHELSQYMSWAIFLLPIGWAIMIARWRRLQPHDRMLLLSSLLFTLFGLLQIRFLPYLALLLGLIIIPLFQRVPSILNTIPIRPIVACVVVVLSYIPCVTSIGQKDITADVYTEMAPLLEWLRATAPPDSQYIHPDTPPACGLIADWNLGHYIQYYGHWPVLADNFGEHATDLRRINRFFLSTENEETYRFLDDNRVKYVLCQDLPSMYQSMILDKHMLTYVSDFDPSTGHIVFDPTMYPTVLCRLVWRYGGAFIDQAKGLYYPPLDRLRLVAESQGKDETLKVPEVAQIKLFEYVPGARLFVTGFPPLTGVVLSTKVITPHGRSFPYVQFLNSNDDGHLSAILPYANEKMGGAYAKEYSLIIGTDSRPLPAVTEDMVSEGQTVELIWE
jgi:asparagine N-glycosylation enzyme membrane subunit Stt3